MPDVDAPVLGLPYVRRGKEFVACVMKDDSKALERIAA